jgi:hypothetical protein
MHQQQQQQQQIKQMSEQQQYFKDKMQEELLASVPPYDRNCLHCFHPVYEVYFCQGLMYCSRFCAIDAQVILPEPQYTYVFK